jgi:hypothetical protein
MKYAGLIGLAIWLILQALETLFKFSFKYDDKILPAINLLAGFILFLYTVKLRRGEIGLFVLGLWATFQSSLFLFHYTFPYSNLMANVLGMLAGILLMIGL